MLNKGREEGREEGEFAVVLRQLQRVTGQLPEASRQQIGQLSRDGLAELSEALLDFGQPGDLVAWLERNR